MEFKRIETLSEQLESIDKADINELLATTINLILENRYRKVKKFVLHYPSV